MSSNGPTQIWAKATWDCQSCEGDGEVEGTVVVQPATPDAPQDAEFYPYISEGHFFAGCLRCGSEDVLFDDVEVETQ